jgi:hypothetical protein
MLSGLFVGTGSDRKSKSHSDISEWLLRIWQPIPFDRFVEMVSHEKKQPSSLSHLKGLEGPRLRFSYAP